MQSRTSTPVAATPLVSRPTFATRSRTHRRRSRRRTDQNPTGARYQYASRGKSRLTLERMFDTVHVWNVRPINFVYFGTLHHATRGASHSAAPPSQHHRSCRAVGRAWRVSRRCCPVGEGARTPRPAGRHPGRARGRSALDVEGAAARRHAVDACSARRRCKRRGHAHRGRFAASHENPAGARPVGPHRRRGRRRRHGRRPSLVALVGDNETRVRG